MKTVTQSFKDQLFSKETAVKREVYFKKRYWQESSKTYIWEDDWTLLPEDQLVSVSAINWQLDTAQLNEFKVSNVTLVVSNLRNEWKADNAYGRFGGDDVSPQGYHPYWMKFQIKAGVDFRDGDTEMVTVFTGLATDYLQDSRGGSMQITLSGIESLLINADAERVSTSVNQENAGTGNGATVNFDTDFTGVGLIDLVSVDGVTKRPGNDYTVSQLNSTTLPARITFVVAPASLTTIRISYRYWRTVQKFEDLVAALLDEAGVDDYSVDPVIFPSKIINRRQFATQDDWNAGTKTAIDTTTSINNLKIDFSDATLARTATTWMDSLNGWLTSAGALVAPTFGPTVQSGTVPAGLTVNTGNQTIYLTTTNFTGETVAGSGFSGGSLNTPQSTGRITAIAFKIRPTRSGTITQVAANVRIQWAGGATTVATRIVLCADASGAPGSEISAVTHSQVVSGFGSYDPGGVTVSFAVTAATNYWIKYEESAANITNCAYRILAINQATGNWSGGGYCLARFTFKNSGCPGAPGANTAWEPVETNQTDGPLGQVSGSYTLTPTAVVGSATWTSPTYDVNPYAYGTTVTLSASGSYAAGLTATVYVDGSNNGSSWTNIGSQVDPAGAYSFTAAVFRYFRVRAALSTTDDRNTPTVNVPSVSFSSSTAVWSASAGLKFTPSSGATQTSGWAYRPNFKGAGRWDFDFKESSSTTDPITLWFHFSFQSVGSLGANNFFNGYSIKISLASTPTIKFIRNDSSTIGTETEIASASITRDWTQNHHIQVYRTALGRFVVLYDGAQKLDVTDLTYTTGNYIGFHIDSQSSEAIELGNYPLYIPPDTITASWVSAAIDAGGTPEAWTPLTITHDLFGGSVDLYTRSSTDNVTYSSDALVPANLQNQAPLRRYAKVRIDITANLLANQDPIVHALAYGSITSQTVISLANFSGMTVYDAISQLAKFANYEWGFTADEAFFFRSKFVTTTPVMELDHTNFLMNLNSVKGGYDQVYSTVRATYGNYQTDVTENALNSTGAIAQFARQRLEVEGGDLLINGDADVATGVANSFFNYYKRARRKFRIEAKFLPLLDLSDTVKVTFLDNFPTPLWVLGDTSVYIGQNNINLYGSSEQILANTLCKVVGIRLDTERWMNEFDLEEILL